MFTTIAVLSLALASTPARVANGTMYRPRVELWTNRGDGAVYTRGERVRLFFRLDQDAYVTIFRVDTDGRVRVLFPRDPWEDNFARGGRDFEVDGRDLDSDAFMIDDYPGVGYLFAVASADAFTYDQIETGDHWDYRAIADGRVRGDPYVAMTDLAQRIVPEGSSDWDYDVVSYNVGQHYDYPRFLCYDCHSYVSYTYWDPYYTSCVRFRMVVYDDPYYYPYRYYGGGRVVFVRPFRPQPRFIFKDWGSDRPSREGFVSRERERPANDNGRRGVTSQDIGGLGVIPPPNVRERGRPGNDGNGNNGNDQRNNGNDNRGNGRRQQPDHPDHPDQPVRPDRPGRPDRPDNPNNPDRPDRRARPDQPDRPQGGRTSDRPVIMPTHEQPGLRDVGADSRRVEPRTVEPRAEPRQVEPRRVEPRNEPRSEPPRAEPRNEPRNQPQPRAEPRNNPPPQRGDSKPRNEPEVRRRKP
jgi:hypothetical protein